MQNAMGWLSFVCSIIGLIYFSYILMHILKRKIILCSDRIFVQEDAGSKDIKLQYKVEVLLDQIERIDMLISSNNSLNQHMRFVITPMPYIVLNIKNGKEKWINAFYYTKKQTIEIIDCIIKKKKIEDTAFTNKAGQELVNELAKTKTQRVKKV
jgi:hypothetical protein